VDADAEETRVPIKVPRTISARGDVGWSRRATDWDEFVSDETKRAQDRRMVIA
jgi:hypothetical protein